MKNLGTRSNSEDIANIGDIKVKDVKAPTRSGNSIVYTSILDANGIAQIPLPDDDVFGVIRRTSSYGTNSCDGIAAAYAADIYSLRISAYIPALATILFAISASKYVLYSAITTNS